jgi:Family of unknown function (DUF6186)
MNSHDVTIAGYLMIAALAGVLQLMSLREGSRIPSFGRLMSRIMRTRTGRVGMAVGWAWLGLHFFAR